MLDATSELQHAYRRSRKVAKSNDLMVDFDKTENRLAVAEVPFFGPLIGWHGNTVIINGQGDRFEE